MPNLQFNNCHIVNQTIGDTTTISTRIETEKMRIIEAIRKNEGFKPASIFRQGLELRFLFPYPEYKKLIAYYTEIKEHLKKYTAIPDIPR